MKKFSIIVVTMNAGEKLKETVDSIIAQTYENVEIIVKDGCSTDHSTDFLSGEKYKNVVFKSEKDGGIYEAMNEAVLMSTGDYLAFINSGDKLYEPDTLEKISKAIDDDSASHDIYYGRSYLAATDSFSNEPQEVTDRGLFHRYICHQAMIYSRSVFDLEMYDTRFRICACLAHYIQLYKRHKVSFLWIPVVICVYEGGGLSDSPKGRKQSIREHRQCLREEFGMKYYLYMLHPTVMYTSLKHRVSTVSFLFPFYREVATIVGSIRDKRRGIKK